MKLCRVIRRAAMAALLSMPTMAAADEAARAPASGTTVDGETDALARASQANKAHDAATALAIYRDLEGRGSATGAMSLGLLSYVGAGVPLDRKRACDLFAEADERGNGSGTELLGDCLTHGDGRPQDYHAAADLYRRAGERGIAISYCALGDLYAAGLGVAQDAAHAAELCHRSADLGVPEAELTYGKDLLTGFGVVKDSAAAIAWLTKAAEKRQPNAELLLGQVYWNGDGTAKDQDRAADFWYAAALHGQNAAPAFLMRYYYLKGLGQPTTVDGQHKLTVQMDAAARCLFWATVAANTDPDPAVKAEMAQQIAFINSVAPPVKDAMKALVAGGKPPSR